MRVNFGLIVRGLAASVVLALLLAASSAAAPASGRQPRPGAAKGREGPRGRRSSGGRRARPS